MTAHFIENLSKLTPTAQEHGPRFAHERRQFASALPDRKLGCSHFVVPPGKSAFPAHSHHANDEVIYILSGQGTLRAGEERHPLEAGDFAYLPAGSGAHQIINDSNAPIAYLCLSSMQHPEILEYPDSGKVGVMGGRAPGGATTGNHRAGFFPLKDKVDYFDGEG